MIHLVIITDQTLIQEGFKMILHNKKEFQMQFVPDLHTASEMDWSDIHICIIYSEHHTADIRRFCEGLHRKYRFLKVLLITKSTFLTQKQFKHLYAVDNFFDDTNTSKNLVKEIHLLSSMPISAKRHWDFALNHEEIEQILLHFVQIKLTNEKIASRLRISIRTVERYLQHLYNKYDVHNKKELYEYIRVKN